MFRISGILDDEVNRAKPVVCGLGVAGENIRIGAEAYST